MYLQPRVLKVRMRESSPGDGSDNKRKTNAKQQFVMELGHREVQLSGDMADFDWMNASRSKKVIDVKWTTRFFRSDARNLLDKLARS